MKKEEIYINLQGKTKEEITDLWEFLDKAGEINFSNLDTILEELEEFKYYEFYVNDWISSVNIKNKTEVTIEQLKQIIKPMGTFTPIAMKCTQEQFDAIKPKLSNIIIEDIYEFSKYNYLANNYVDRKNVITNVDKHSKCRNNRTVHETWNEEIFLKACGIEVESLEQQLQKAEAEVKRLQYLIEEENKPKIGDWVKNEHGFIGKLKIKEYTSNLRKITNIELIKLLEDEIK